MENAKPLTAHERLSAFAMVARLDAAIHFAMANQLADREAWFRDYRDHLQVFIDCEGQHAAKFISMMEPLVADFEREMTAFTEGR